jgi:type II secretory pathway pseudopilin PulG
MRLAGSRRRSSAGFTLLESLIGLLLAAVATGTIADTLTGLLKRSYITIEVTRLSDASERFASAFTQAGKSATAWAVYPDRSAYLADPIGNISVEGNVLVFQDQLPDATIITELFEYDPVAQTLARYENSLSQQRSLLNKVVYSTGRTTAFGQDLGLVQAHWTVQSPYELLDFEAYGKPLRMR